ncbi:MAG TPA: hypothetical protein VMF06_11620 [Candidatus Limnocylindria bacterium]|jgi:hypothetical protein|nr:hypothetical protein [Candidatus Limnocylindria bacterium]
MNPSFPTLRQSAGLISLRRLFDGFAATIILLGTLMPAVSARAGAQGGLTNGATMSGTLALDNTTDQWTFSASAGQHVIIRFASGEFTGRLNLLGPDGLPVLPAPGDDRDIRLEYDVVTPGIYTADIASAPGQGLGNYRLGFVQPGTPLVVPPGDEGGPLANGARLPGAMALGDLDVWTFSAQAGDYVVIRLATTNFYGQLSLFGPDGAPAAPTTDINTDVEIYLAVAVAGTYTVVATSGYPNGTGTYRLQFARPAETSIPPGEGDGGSMANGGRYNGSMGLGDVDQWTFSAKVGDYVTIQFGAPTNFYGRLSLVGPDGALAAPIPPWDSDVRFAFQAAQEGTYTVLVSSAYAGGVGSYRMYFAQPASPLTPSGGDDGGALTNGGRHQGFIDLGDLDIWTFTAQAGNYVVARMAGTNVYGHLSLYGPDGKPAAPESNIDRDVQIAFSAAQSGIYTLVANSGYANSTGAYQLYLANAGEPAIVPAGDEGGPLANGGRHDGRIELGDLDQWTFEAQAGQTVLVRFASQEFSGRIDISGPDGTLVAPTTDIGRDVLIEYRVVKSGTHRVLVSNGARGESGTYHLYFAKPGDPLTIPAGDQGGPIANGGTYAGQIDLGDLDLWTFDAHEGQSIVVRFGSPDFPARLELFKPDGTLVSLQIDNDTAIEYAVTNAGHYTVVVSAANGTGIGAYSLAFAQPGSPVAVPAGDDGGVLVNGGQYDGSVTLGDLDEWTFEAKPGETVNLRYFSVDFAGRIELYDPSGALVSVYNEYDRYIRYPVTNAGIYTVLVGSAYARGVGNYRLQFSQPGRPLLPDPSGDGGLMVNGGRYAGNLELGDLDSWTFSAVAGETVTVKYASAVMRGQLLLYGPGGALLFDRTYDHDMAIEWVVGESGMYTVVVQDADIFQTGAYELYFAQPRTPALVIPSGDEGGPMQNGGVYSGTIKLGDLDEWTFSAVSGEHVGLRFASSEFRGRAELFDAKGVLVRDFGYGYDFSMDFDAASTETYTVLLSAIDANTTGHYRLSLVQPSVPPIASAGTLASGANHDGVLPFGGLQEWTFAAQAGERVFLRLGSADFTPQLTLYGPGGILLRSAGYSSYDAAIEYAVTNSGLFTAVVGSWVSGGAGSYRLRFAHPPESFVVPEAESGGGLTSEAVAGRLGFADQNLWRFAACTGDPIQLRLLSTNLYARMDLFGPDGGQLGTVQGVKEMALRSVAPTCGVYQILIRTSVDGATGSTGSYWLTSNGRLAGPNLCSPTVTGETMIFKGVGGLPGTGCVLYTTIDIVASPVIWVPFATNRFDSTGLVNVTNDFPIAPPRFFRIGSVN